MAGERRISEKGCFGGQSKEVELGSGCEASGLEGLCRGPRSTCVTLLR